MEGSHGTKLDRLVRLTMSEKLGIHANRYVRILNERVTKRCLRIDWTERSLKLHLQPKVSPPPKKKKLLVTLTLLGCSS